MQQRRTLTNFLLKATPPQTHESPTGWTNNLRSWEGEIQIFKFQAARCGGLEGFGPNHTSSVAGVFTLLARPLSPEMFDLRKRLELKVLLKELFHELDIDALEELVNLLWWMLCYLVIIITVFSNSRTFCLTQAWV